MTYFWDNYKNNNKQKYERKKQKENHRIKQFHSCI